MLEHSGELWNIVLDAAERRHHRLVVLRACAYLLGIPHSQASSVAVLEPGIQSSTSASHAKYSRRSNLQRQSVPHPLARAAGQGGPMRFSEEKGHPGTKQLRRMPGTVWSTRRWLSKTRFFSVGSQSPESAENKRFHQLLKTSSLKPEAWPPASSHSINHGYARHPYIANRRTACRLLQILNTTVTQVQTQGRRREPGETHSGTSSPLSSNRMLCLLPPPSSSKAHQAMRPCQWPEQCTTA
jgi:hypothetical protein